MKLTSLFIICAMTILSESVMAQTSSYSINDRWFFHLGDEKGAMNTLHDTSAWDRVMIPHTWNNDAYVGIVVLF